MTGRLLGRVVRVLNRLLTIDVSRVYRLKISQCRRPSSENSGWQTGFVSAAELRPHLADPTLGLFDHHLRHLESDTVKCFAATDGGILAGYIWFTEGEVDPEHNKAGRRFKGIGMRLGPGMCYLFKAFVAPPYRGQALMGRMIHDAGLTLSRHGFDEIVTTTGLENEAFQRSAGRVGFEPTGVAVELALFGKHFFLLPRLDARVEMQPGR